ncbi:MAG: hypothetical protein K9I94_04835 [Bacteroidales bacterium]|nr:hypothetical protein [Bacteroidales bacterium]
MKPLNMLNVLLFLLIPPLMGYSQVQQQSNVRKGQRPQNPIVIHDEDQPIGGGGGYFKPDICLEGEAGSIYLNDEFIEGALTLENGSQIDDLSYRYNLYTQQMEFIKGEDSLALAKPSEISELHFDDHVFVWERFLTRKGEIKCGYFELLSEGKINLLLRRQIAYHVSAECDGLERFTPDTYVRVNSFYYQHDDQPAQMLKPRERRLMKLFSDEKETIRGFMVNKAIDVNRKEDLMRLFSYYNEICE